MPTTQAPQCLQRLRGIGLVALVHLLMIWALTSGLTHGLLAPQKTITQVSLKTPDSPPPQLPTPSPIDEPMISKAPVLVPPIDQPVIQEAKESTSVQIIIPSSNDGPGQMQTTVVSTGSGSAGSAAKVVPQVEAPTLICTRMTPPEAPAVAWSGDAVLRVLATVQAGRVSAVQLLAIQGSLDARTRRALLGSVERALRDGYECPGEHRFEQEFRFKID